MIETQVQPLEAPQTKVRKLSFRSIALWFFLALAFLWSLAALVIVAARWIDPPTTAVHMQRRLQSWMRLTTYNERYEFVPLSRISPDFQHAVIAASAAAPPSRSNS